MSRRSSRLVLQPSPTGQQKKRAPDNPSPSLDTTRAAKRTKSSGTKPLPREAKPRKSTGTKSKYFEEQPSESLDAESTELSEVASTTPSAYEGSKQDSAGVPSDMDEAESIQGDSESEPKKKKRGGWGWSGGRKKKTKEDATETEAGSSAAGKKGKELWREGVRTGLGPGKEVFIKIPQARDAGDTPYEDGTIHPNTMLFLKDLKANNQREWLKMHDADFRTSKKDWDTFVESLTPKIIEQDSTIPELPAKDLVWKSRTGRKGPYAAYYLHMEPGKCFIGSGIWMPDAHKLALLRQDMDQNSQRIKAVLTRPDIRKDIFNGIPKDERKAVLAFVGQNKESALKTKPKGYDADNQNIDLLRLRSFTVSKKLEDKDLLGPEALDRVARIVGILEPFVTYLNSVVMPDPIDEDPSDDDDDVEEGSDEEDGEPSGDANEHE
ncbi:hypothetical protein FQN50_009671 [Emmonsiellopsis sp. PD_5]|nr:hypothetical protein FQN50_009671 [Emmonsiellopsis sp. PD_5]